VRKIESEINRELSPGLGERKGEEGKPEPEREELPREVPYLEGGYHEQCDLKRKRGSRGKRRKTKIVRKGLIIFRGAPKQTNKREARSRETKGNRQKGEAVNKTKTWGSPPSEASSETL